MPQFTKEALSRYIATGCQRQLRLYLTPDTQAYAAERAAAGMPPPQPPRPGLQSLRAAGEEWGRAKVADLAMTFGPDALVGTLDERAEGPPRYRPTPLATVLPAAAPGRFLVEAEYAIGPAFEAALGIASYRARFQLDYAQVRPDLLIVYPPGHFGRRVRPDGTTAPLVPEDARLQLRVVDVKLTAAQSPPYFAEVALYTLALAGWLEDQGLADHFVVVPEGAVWPGAHAASRLMVRYHELQRAGAVPDPATLHAALEEDLEPVPFAAFAFRLRRFFQEELPEVLAQPWQALPFHVDNRCSGCEYLGAGYAAGADAYCLPLAERTQHLSRVAFITRGASTALRERGISDVPALAARGADDPAFDGHQELRATRAVVASRARALLGAAAHIPPDAGTSASMPRWADLRLFVSADFDLGSALTLALGLHAVWVQPAPPDAPEAAARATSRWRGVFIVDQKDLAAERRELLAFLGKVHDVLAAAQQRDPRTTMQLYLWDALQYEHLARIIGRHLDTILADRKIDYLAWLFPPEELLPNAALLTRRSPITIVREVIRPLLAAPVAHYYTLLDVARHYHYQGPDEATGRFAVDPLFENVLSDQIPSERAHEIWSRATRPRHWQSLLRLLEQTVDTRLMALASVVRRLEADLRPRLRQAAPPVRIQPPAPQGRVSADGQLWYWFARLNEALADLDIQQVRAMPPAEREARFRSARLARRLTGAEETAALAHLGLAPAPGRRVYALRPTSAEVKLREGDFTLALAPEDRPGLLEQPLRAFLAGTPLEGAVSAGWQDRLEHALAVSVAALDRDRALIALDPSRRWVVTDPASGERMSFLDAAERAGLLDLSMDVILDPVHYDFFTRRLLKALEAIGNPPTAQASPLVQRATGQRHRSGARRTAATPPADLLWDARAMHETPVARPLAPARAALEQSGLHLNPTQWRAWEAALTRRLQLIWGPPGTGKSRTVEAILLGAALAAAAERRPLRILLCAATYTALDNVLVPVYARARDLLPALAESGLYRLRSDAARPAPAELAAIDVELDRRQPSARVRALRERLAAGTEALLVAATPQQVHNLLVADDGAAQQEWFDLLVIDEASQMDVASAVLALCALARGGSVVLAGDARQLPPIHEAEPPLGLAPMVGSLYTFCEQVHGVPALMLDTSYRANATLVALARHAGYERGLRSHSPDLCLDLLAPLPATPPPGWPADLPWSPEWAALLNPAHPAVCFVYRDGRSSQSNPFEADAVAALARLLYGRVAAAPRNERDPVTGALRAPAPRVPCDVTTFWQRVVGVVTPHRAQQGLLIRRLQEVFAGTGAAPALIRDAVDTVERFQGQQRDVILASFALGDPDVIATEEEFLLSLNRFNVMASRARTKLIVFVSQEIVDHLASDAAVLRESQLLKAFVHAFCRAARPMTLPYRTNGACRAVPGLYRYRAAPRPTSRPD